MLLMTIVYDDNTQDVFKDLQEMKQYFADKHINIGISESLNNNNHFIKVFCEDDDLCEKTVNMFNLYLANILYKVVIYEFYKREMSEFLSETYFFLKEDELKEINGLCLNALESNGQILDESMVYCINRKNNAIRKIQQCIDENKEININGFVTFRMKEIIEELENIVDKVIEKYMAEKEYNEFIKLLKYFVDIQESKIEEINILVEQDGNYQILNGEGDNILSQLLNELTDAKYSGTVSMEDVIISGLITNAPKKVIIHCAENCLNKEFIDTIKNVFQDRAVLCSSCKNCESLKHSIKV